MQPEEEYIKQASWGRWLLIAGVISFIFGGLFFYYQLSQLPEIIDPNKNNVADVNIGEQTSVDLRSSCYVAWSENTSTDISFKIFDVGDVEIAEASCGLDFEAMDAEGTRFQRIGSWEINNGTYNIHAICTSDSEGRCNEGTVMLVDYDEIMDQILGDSAFILSCFVCLAGIILLPLGGVLLHMAGRKKQGMGVIMMEDGSISTTNQVDSGELEHFVGQQATDEAILTTDEVYSLMHGSEKNKVEILEKLSTIEGDTENSLVPDPFADSMFKGDEITPQGKIDEWFDKSSKTEENTQVGSAWKDWDEG